MSALPPEIEQSDLMLAEAAKSDLVAMRHVQQLLLASDEAREVGVLAHAYARVSRCMRQNLALLARQKADRAKAEREAARSVDPREQQNPVEVAVEERADDLQHAVDRVISAAAEGERKLHADWAHRFDRELDDWMEADDFLDEPLQAQVLRACRTLGLPEDLAAQWQDLPDPTFIPDPEPETAEEIAATNAVCREATAWLKAASRRDPTDPVTPPRIPWKSSG